MLITLFWPGRRPRPPTHRVVTCCLSPSGICSCFSSISMPSWLGNLCEGMVCALFSCMSFQFRRVIMFSSTPTAASWRYQILAHPRGWRGSTPARRLSQVRFDLPAARLNHPRFLFTHQPSTILQVSVKLLKSLHFQETTVISLSSLAS